MSAPRLRIVSLEQTSLVAEGIPVRFPQDAVDVAQRLIGAKDREHFIALHLDASHRVVSSETVAIGSLTTAQVHPREVFKAAILSNAAAIIVAHNHPSGSTEPSQADRLVYERLRDAGKLLGIPLLDFLIVSPDKAWSAADAWAS